MFVLETKVQYEATLRRIWGIEAKAEDIRKQKGSERAELYVKAFTIHLADLKEQVRLYENKKGELK